LKTHKRKVNVQKHSNPSLQKWILEDSSLVVCVDNLVRGQKLRRLMVCDDPTLKKLIEPQKI